MKKYILLSLLISTTSFGQQCLESKVSYYRDGNLRFQSILNYDEKGKIIKKSETHSGNDEYYTTESLYEYDAKGNNTKTIFKQNNVFRNVTLKQYSTDGILISEELSNNEKATPTEQTKFTNNIAEKTFKDSKNKERKAFDKDGRILEIAYLDEKDNVKRSTKNEYDLKGNLLKTTIFDAFDKLSKETSYEYDANGNPQKEKNTRNGILLNQTVFEYNQAGKLTRKTRIDATDEVDFFYTYEHNQAGQMSKEIYSYDNQTVNYTTFQYDAKGNKIKESYYSLEGELTGYREWEYSCK